VGVSEIGLKWEFAYVGWALARQSTSSRLPAYVYSSEYSVSARRLPRRSSSTESAVLRSTAQYSEQLSSTAQYRAMPRSALQSRSALWRRGVAWRGALVALWPMAAAVARGQTARRERRLDVVLPRGPVAAWLVELAYGHTSQST
jgi:hypothetical protein